MKLFMRKIAFFLVLFACNTFADEVELTSSWYYAPPYVENDNSILKGIDIELMDLFTKESGYKLLYEYQEWDAAVKLIKKSALDMLSGARISLDRGEFAKFSIPYRVEETMFFYNKHFPLGKQNIEVIVARIIAMNKSFGVVKGGIFPNEYLNNFVKDPKNSKWVKEYENANKCAMAVRNLEIVGFFAESLEGTYSVVKNKSEYEIMAVDIGLTNPIAIMFNHKIHPHVIIAYNQAINKMKNSNQYRNIMRHYCYPLMLTKIVKSKWFINLMIIGTIAFSISGLILAVHEKASLLGTVILCALPCVGGGIVRDIMLSRDLPYIFTDSYYIKYVALVALIGFAIVRLAQYFQFKIKPKYIKFFNHITVVCDAIGQATYAVMGVVIAIINASPKLSFITIAILSAFLSSNGGGMIRDMLTKKGHVNAISGNIRGEIVIFWSAIMAILLDHYAIDPIASVIYKIVIICFFGIIVTQILFHFLKIKNLMIISTKG